MLQYCLGKPNTLFLRISARTPTSALPQRAPTRQSIKSNKRSSRIDAPRPSFLTFLNSRDKRKTCFSYHFIYNILAFTYDGGNPCILTTITEMWTEWQTQKRFFPTFQWKIKFESDRVALKLKN